MIRFPKLKYPYTDTAEGGMYAIMAVLESESTESGGYQHNCYIDVSINMSPPDRVVGDQSMVWTPRATNMYSVDLLAVIHLGSTPYSLWNEQADSYWMAGFLDLTDEGHQLYNLLKNTYKVEPRIITLRDT